MTLDQLANYADIVGTVMVVGGLSFRLIQLSEFRKQRRDIIAAELMRTFYSVDLADAVTLVRSLPDHCPADELRQRGAEYERAAVIVNTSFETMGLLVFRRIADYGLVEQLAGGMVTVLWRKLDAWVAAVRAEQAQPSWAEWFEWRRQAGSVAQERGAARLRRAQGLEALDPRRQFDGVPAQLRPAPAQPRIAGDPLARLGDGRERSEAVRRYAQ